MFVLYGIILSDGEDEEQDLILKQQLLKYLYENKVITLRDIIIKFWFESLEIAELLGVTKEEWIDTYEKDRFVNEKWDDEKQDDDAYSNFWINLTEIFYKYIHPFTEDGGYEQVAFGIIVEDDIKCGYKINIPSDVPNTITPIMQLLKRFNLIKEKWETDVGMIVWDEN